MSESKTSAKKPKVLVTCNLQSLGIEALQKAGCEVILVGLENVRNREYVLKAIADADALICNPLNVALNEELLDHAANLKVVATTSVGYDHISVSEFKQRGVKLGYTPGVLTEATAELTVALLLMTSRRLVEAHDAVMHQNALKMFFRGHWGHWDPLWMCGHGIHEKVVGIVGLGRIGFSVAEKVKSFHPSRLLYCGRKAKPDAARLDAEFVAFGELLSQSDYVVITCALSEETRNLFDAEAFSKMKPTAILINTSRGGLVDQEALYQALLDKRIAAAGLDVCAVEPISADDKLLKLQNVVVLPHVGSATVETRTKMTLLTVDNVLAALLGKPMPAEIP